MTTATVTANPMRESSCWPPAPSAVSDFHRRMPGYEPSPLLESAALARDLGIGRLMIKSETARMGLPSFKILGASWATYRAICAYQGREPEPWDDLHELAAQVAALKPLKLVTATDGNHGRAVAFMAQRLGFQCEVFVPAGISRARVDAIKAEGATVTVIDGDYDDAVAHARQQDAERCLVISDTSPSRHGSVATDVVDGYSTIFAEVDDAVRVSNLSQPDLVVIPIGVGALMAAAVTHYREDGRAPVGIVGVEPLDANCIQASVTAGHPVQVPGPHNSIMAGLNCGIPSMVAWPRVASGVDWFVSVDDDAARQAMRALSGAGIVAGETGAAALAGLRALLTNHAFTNGSAADAMTALIVVTEGATDPASYRRIVGTEPSCRAASRVPVATPVTPSETLQPPW